MSDAKISLCPESEELWQLLGVPHRDTVRLAKKPDPHGQEFKHCLYGVKLCGSYRCYEIKSRKKINI